MEALGVIWAVKHFRQYLYGHHCHVHTDHEALKSLLNSPHPSGKLARWGLAIQELDLIIHYKPGCVNQKADASSRAPFDQSHEGGGENSLVAAVQSSPPVFHKGRGELSGVAPTCGHHPCPVLCLPGTGRFTRQ